MAPPPLGVASPCTPLYVSEVELGGVVAIVR